MKRIILAIVAVVALIACNFSIIPETGNGVPVETALDPGEFDALSIPSSIDVVYKQTTGEQSITFTCDENLKEYYNIRVENNTLIAGMRPGITNIRPRVKTVLTVNSPVLKEVRLSGSGDCVIESPVKADENFLIKVTGSGDIQTKGLIECKDFSSRTSGSGDIGVAGVVSESAELKVTGSGNVGVDGLTAQTITASTSGSGDIILKCKDAGDIEASITGSGDIILTGNARTLKSSDSGSGDIVTRDFSLQGK
jgi:hypothetical protein